MENKIEVDYFTVTDGLDERTKTLLNWKLEDLKKQYEFLLNEINQKKDELEGVIHNLKKQVKRLKEIDLDEMKDLMERLKDATESPLIAWKAIKLIFGDQYIKSYIVEEIGELSISMNVLTDEFEKISDLLNVQINKVEKNIAKRISNDSSS